MADDPAPKPEGWTSAWPDALAFAGGLALAWFGKWETRDLVWSLWLSSLVVGYAMIVWTIFSPLLPIGRGIWNDRALLGGARVPAAAGVGLTLVGGLFILGFFTVHFGGFHFGHSVFLAAFFPLDAEAKGLHLGLAYYGRVAADYWPFVLVAAVAERHSFRPAPADEPPDTSVKAADVNQRLAKGRKGFTGMMAPYKNVVRMHLLIFFFAFAHFAKLGSFLVYAVVYAAYFLPWRLLSRTRSNES